MTNKPTFLYGLSEKKEFNNLRRYFNVPKINWNKGTITPKIGKVDTLIGFSLGCMLAIMHAEKNKVKNLVLYSPSPGEETLEKIKADRVTIIVGEKERWVRQDLLRLIKTAKKPISIHTVLNRNDKQAHKVNELFLISLCESL